MKYNIPDALFNSKATFNPYQYEPFSRIFVKGEDEKWVWNKKNILINDEVGVGKTIETAIIIKQIFANGNPKKIKILIICPNKLCDQWKNEMSTFTNLNFTIYQGKEHELPPLSIVPYSRVNMSNLQNRSYDVLVLDEAHYIRNASQNDELYVENEAENKNASRYHYIKSLVEKNKGKLKIFLSATPIFNDVSDLDNITSLLYGENTDKAYETTTTLQGEANLYRFKLNIKSIVTKFTDDGINKTIMDNVMRGSYGRNTGFIKRIATSSIYSLNEFLENKNAFKNESYFDFTSSNQNESADEYADLKNTLKGWESKFDEKLATLKTLLETISAEPDDDTDNSTKGVVIFSTLINTGKYLENMLKSEYKVFRVDGTIDTNTVSSIIKNFKNYTINHKPTLKILICSEAFREGQNLQFCQHLIHYDFPFTPAALSQRNGRIYRKGINKNPNIYYMIVEGSYDERLFGEIIVNKSQIIKNESDKGSVAIINVLPQDSQDSEKFLEQCIVSIFDDKVKELTGEDINKNIKSTFFKLIKLKFSFSSEEIDKLKEKNLVDLYEYFGVDNVEDVGYTELFVSIFSDIQETEILFDVYKNKYIEQFKKINNLFFSEVVDSKSIEDCNEYFIENCKKYLEDKNIGEQKFCHDLISDENLNYEEYIIKFKTLNKIKRESRQNNDIC